ncbi:arylamine N-acetyltransferase family protein [Nocardioides bigeumensis]|uniref:Arylamine N-acetyltransferase n=1 Tax=Nocardioides bigeumensis TaxID=433657 RepID=A0ABN2XVL0_9ACTN
MTALPPALTDDHKAYLGRLGFDTPPPATLESLVALHRAHLDAVPYENLDIMLGRPASTEPADVVARLGRGGRAGYCFHQNGALGSLLVALGYDVDRRHGHVWTDPGHRFDTSLNHLVLLVRRLPTDDHLSGTWWPDVGLGEGFRDPVPLTAGQVRDPSLDFEVMEVTDEGWSFRGGVDTVRGCVATHVGLDGDSTRDLSGFDEWREVLADGQRLPLDDVPLDDLRALWDRTAAAHRAWVAAGRL